MRKSESTAVVRFLSMRKSMSDSGMIQSDAVVTVDGEKIEVVNIFQ